MHRLVLVRHAISEIPRPGFEDEYTRPLALNGFAQAEAIQSRLAKYQPAAIYSSPYLRAVQTVDPVASALGLVVHKIEDFREHRMANTPIPDWEEVLRKEWDDFNYVPPTGESFVSTKIRGLGVLRELAEKHPADAVLLAGHGTIISLMLHEIDSSIECEFHLAMPSPAIFVLETNGIHWSPTRITIDPTFANCTCREAWCACW